MACCDRGYDRPSLRAVGSTSRKPGVLGCSFDKGTCPERSEGGQAHPATYCSSTPRVQPPAVSRWHSLLQGLATAIHETAGLGEIMNQRLSDKCGDCVWWYEGPLLCEGCPNNPASETMKLHCSQCEKNLVVGDSCEIAFENDRFHLFCSKGCKEKWEELRTSKQECPT